MAGIIPGFMSGATCVIRIGNSQLAYVQNLSFSRSVRNAQVRGVGSYSVHALEPVDYEAAGSFNIVRYTSDMLFGGTVGGDTITGRKDILSGDTLPSNLTSAVQDEDRNGNSMIDELSFNPRKLLLSHTFDIDVYERQGVKTGNIFDIKNQGKLIFTFEDCRLTSFSYAFTPGQLLTEQVSFQCLYIKDAVAGDAIAGSSSSTDEGTGEGTGEGGTP